MAFQMPDGWSVETVPDFGVVGVRENAGRGQVNCWLAGESRDQMRLVVDGDAADNDVPLMVIYELAWRMGMLP